MGNFPHEFSGPKYERGNAALPLAPVHNGEMVRKQAIVHGEVQGVGFRFHAQSVAARLGAAGFVRNLGDGTVMAEVEGDEATVGRMIEWLGSGPTWARVTAVDVVDLAPLGDREFRILD